MSSLTSGIQLAPLSVDIRANYGTFQTDMTRVGTLGTATANKLSSTFSSMTKIGTSISSVGSTLTKSVTLPLAGLGLAIGKIGMDYESQMSRVKAISGATGEEFKKLDEQAISLGASTAFSATEAAQGMENLASAGFNTNEIMQAMPGMMDLAASSGEDLASSADIAASTLRGFGLEASQAAHVADVLAKNSADTNAAVADTGEAMKYAAPVAHSMGLSLEEVTASIGEMANAGIKGSEAGTTLRTSLSRLADPSTEAAEAMKKLNFTAFDGSGKLLSLKDIIGNLRNSTKDLTMQQKQQAISTIFGTEAMSGMLTLVDAGPEQLEELTNSLKNSDGAAKEMAETMQDNAKSGVEQMMGSLETAAIKIEKSVAPTVIKIADKVGELADKFSNLSEKQQEDILEWGALAMAVGPFLKIVGGGMSLIGGMGTKLISLGTAAKAATTATTALGTASSVAGGTSGLGALASGLGVVASVAVPLTVAFGAIAGTIYAVHENNELLNTSLDKTTEDLSPLQRMWNDMDGGIIKSKEDMEKLGLIHHEWSNDVAPETQEAINKTAKCWQDMNLEIKNSEVNNIVIDSSTAQRLQQDTSNVCNAIVQEIKNKQIEANKSLGEYFNVDNSLDSYEQSLLSFFDKSSLEQQQKVTECKDKINAIYQKASEEHRAITNTESTQIGTLQQEMSNVQIDTLAKSNEEMLELQANFNVKMRNTDLDGASELMQEKAQKRDEDVAKDKEYYDSKIELLTNNLANMNQPQRIAAEAEINKLKDERDKKLKIDRDTYDGYLKTIEEKYPEIADRIDLYTGKILSDKEYKDKQSLEEETKHYSNIDRITESGMQRLYDTSTKTWDDVYVNVDENTGKINGVWNKSKDKIVGANNDIANNLYGLTSKYSNFTESQKNDLLQAISSNNDYDSNTRAIASSVIGQLQGVGNTIDGVYYETIMCNGQPVQVQVNKDGTIANLQEIINKINQIDKNIPVTCWVQYRNADTGEVWNGNKNASNGYGYNADGTPISHYNGLENVPYDGYYARLHKDERVLTAKENEAYNQLLQHGSTGQGTTINFNGNYSFNNKDDIDYMLNQAALKIKGARG